MAYQMAATAVTLNDLEGHSQVARLFKCSLSNICAAFYTISTGSVLARFLCISRASCYIFSFDVFLARGNCVRVGVVRRNDEP